MVEQRQSSSRGFLKPVIYGVLLILVIIGAVFFRSQIWDGIKWLTKAFTTWLTEWVPDHPGASGAIIGFAVVAFALNWFAHVRGRLRAWVFAIVVEIGLWLLFWYGLIIPSFNELFGLNIERITPNEVVLSGVIVIALTGLIFWILESREEWNKYRRRHNAED
jgi:membrane associated rhomboid family serine protease